ncbi:hypothetical protein RUND412_009326 [Rhizina undulata]
MASKPPAITAGPSSTSRRQPMRQARTNPRKNAAASMLHGRGGPVNGTGQPTVSNQPPAKFYPALTAFTDAIDALPSETIRHFTLLREVDAKACAPEATLRSLIASARALPPPDNPYAFDPALEAVKQLDELQRRREELVSKFEQELLNQMEIAKASEGAGVKSTILGHPETRRARCAQIRALISEILVTLDEKIHVITTAFEALQKHLQRVEHAFTFVQHEIPDVYRLGSKEHWAYNEPVKKGTAAAQARAAERAQREAEERLQQQQQQREIETNSRSETRREALRQKAVAAAAAMQEEEDHGHQSRGEQSQPTKKLHGNSKIRKEQEALASAKRLAEHQSANGGGGLVPAAGTSTATPAPPQQKRRKTGNNVKEMATTATAATAEKPTVASTSGKGIGSPRAATPATSSKRGGKTATGAAGRGGRRNAAASAANSPNLASSPVHTTFYRDLPTATPTTTTASAINHTSSSTTKTDLPTTTKASESSSRPGTSSKSGKKEKDKDKDAHKEDERPITAGSAAAREKKASATELRETIAKGVEDRSREDAEKVTQSESKVVAEKEEKTKKRRKDDDDDDEEKKRREEKKEEKEKKRKRPVVDDETPHEEKPTRHGKARPSTADSVARETKNETPAKRGRDRKRAEPPPVMKIEESEVEPEDERMIDDGDADADVDAEEGDGDEDEPVYCYCQQVSYGEMVACDGDNCQREWFHLDCVGLQQAPKGKAIRDLKI